VLDFFTQKDEAGWAILARFGGYPVDRLPPKKKKSHRILMGICTGRGTKLLVY
jgi:hypothetical protein